MKSLFLGKAVLSAVTIFSVSSHALGAIAEYAAGPTSEATFEAVGRPSMLKIKGHGAKVEGSVQVDGANAKGKFNLDLNQFTTGIGLRDSHMKERYLETPKYPKSVFEIEQVELPSDWAPGKSVESAKFKGKLTIKDVTKPVEGTVKIAGEQLATEANFNISLKDYPIGVPSYMGVSVADNVNVRVAIPAFTKK